MARVSVRDDGPGVAPEMQHQLFEPGVSSKTGGWGMGAGRWPAESSSSSMVAACVSAGLRRQGLGVRARIPLTKT